MGAAMCLRDTMKITSSQCDVWKNLVVSGVSGGALVAAALRYAPERLNEIAEFVSSTNKTLTGVLNAIEEGSIINAPGGLEVCVARTSDGGLVRLKDFVSFEALEDALNAATFIPKDFHPFDLLLTKTSSYNSGYLFQNQYLYMDAGISGHFMPLDENTKIGITPFSVSRTNNNNNNINVVCPEEGSSKTNSLLSVTKSNIQINMSNIKRFHISMFGSSKKILNTLVQNGYSDCAVSLKLVKTNT